MDTEQRKAFMLKMREANIEDSKIGRVFDISRQRVGQLLGPNGNYGKWTEDNVDLIKQMFENGDDMHSISMAVESSDTRVRDKLLTLYSRSEWVRIKHLRHAKISEWMFVERDASIKARLIEFKSTLNGNIARPIELMRYSRSLYSVANMVKPVEQWFEECGIECKRVERNASR